MLSKLFLAMLLIPALLAPTEAPADKTPSTRPKPAGALVIVGGGGTPDRVKRRALELAGGPDTAILVFPQASTRETSGEAIASMWREVGAKQVSIADLEEPKLLAAQIEEAGLIWFGGGSQNRLMQVLTDHELIAALIRRHGEGAVLGGTSAGAAIMSDPMLSGKVRGTGIEAGATELKPGLGLVKGLLVDQHFLARKRFQRLCAAILDRPDLLGVGIDERTAIVVTGSNLEVIGESGVILLDAGKALISETENSKPRSFQDLRVHQLTAGQSFDLEDRRSRSRSGH